MTSAARASMSEPDGEKRRKFRLSSLRLSFTGSRERSSSVTRSSFSSDMPATARSQGATTTAAPSVKTPLFEIPQQFAANMDLALKNMLDAMDDLSQWDFHSKRQGVKGYSKADGKLMAILGIGTLPFPPRMLLDYIFEASHKTEFDVNCASSIRLRTYDRHTVVEYFATKAILMVSSRDFVNLVHWRPIDEDGSIAIIGKAIADPKMPPKSGYVRAEVHLAGWKITPHGTGSHVTYMLKTDLKGSIPYFVQNKAMLDQAFLMLQVKKALEKRTPLPFSSSGGVSVTTTAATSEDISELASLSDTSTTPEKDLVEPSESPRRRFPAWASPLYTFACFLCVLYGLPYTGVHPVVYDVLVWNAIVCMCFVLFMVVHPA
ncbi:hypothetical protein AC1031_007356 [Aphanomyces cochlioides]|nr:hypothetical protein AC1031_007356 [Aphanomyces cochlioides]